MKSSSLRHTSIERLEFRIALSAGDFDNTFSSDGRAQITFPGLDFSVVDTAIAPSGRIIVAGTRGDNVAVARLLSDGSLDVTFGNGGLFETPGGYAVRGVDVELNADERVIVGLSTDVTGNDGVLVARLAVDGQGLDPTFGTNGITNVSILHYHSTRDVIATRDGKILVAGNAADGDILVVRYTSNGSLDAIVNGSPPDTAFSGDGQVRIGWGGDKDSVQSINIDHTGTPASNPYYGYISVVGGKYALSTSNDRFVVMRLTPNGGMDTAFDGDGVLTSPNLSTSPIEFATSVTHMPGGKTVVAGYAGNADPNARNFLVARYNPNGTPDATFGAGGIFEYGFAPSKAIAYSITTGFRGGLLVAGEKAGTLAMIALTKAGQLDTRFSGDGILTTTEPLIATGLDVTLDQIAPARKIVVAGGSGRVARLIDVGSSINFENVSPEMNEGTGQSATFRVSRTEALDLPETILIGTSGSMTISGSGRDFNATNMLFGNGVTTSTQVVIPAGASSVQVTFTPINDTLAEGDEFLTLSVSDALTYDAGPTRQASFVLRDNDIFGGPTVTGSGFQYDTYPQSATISFDRNVQSSFTIGDLVVTGPGATPPAYSLNYSLVTNTGTVVFYNGLTDGDYTVRVKGSGVTYGGTPMAADYTFGFFFLKADANHDRAVNFDDLLTLAQNYGQTGKTFSQGNIDYSADGLVGFDDLLLLAQRYGTSLAATAPQTSGVKRRAKVVDVLQ